MGGITLIPNVNPISKTPTAIQAANTRFTAAANSWNDLGYQITNTLSGAVTGSVYKTIASVTGAGVLNFVALLHQNATTATQHSIRITLDGAVVVTQSISMNAANSGMVTVGQAGYIGTSSAPDMLVPLLDYIPFSQSMLIEYTSDLTVTDKATIYYKYRTI